VSSPQADQLAASVVAYQAQTQGIRTWLQGYLQHLWASLGEYRETQSGLFTAQFVPVLIGAQQQMASLTAAGLSVQRQMALGGPFHAVGVDPRRVTGDVTRNGTPLAEVYGRPFHTVWRQLHDLPHEPGAIEQAISDGLDQAMTDAVTDLQRTKALTAREAMADDDRVVGYRRVLEGVKSCGLCIVASTQRYHKAELLPVHPGCDCSVVEIFGTHDPGRTIAAHVNIDGRQVPIAELPDVHDRIAQRFGADNSAAGEIDGAVDAHGRILKYRDALVTHEHGELGPVLGVRGQDFTGPGDLKTAA
jgi:hypothetical protein